MSGWDVRCISMGERMQLWILFFNLLEKIWMSVISRMVAGRCTLDMEFRGALERCISV